MWGHLAARCPQAQRDRNVSPEHAAMTKDEAQRSIRTFYEAVKDDGNYSGVEEPIEKGSFAGCSKMPRCKAPEILSREAYFLVR